MKKSILRALQGALFSIGAPVGWLGIQYFLGADLVLEVTNNLLLYGYMLFATMIVFVLFGFYVGDKEEFILKLSIIDPLTSIYNLRFYMERFQQELSFAHRTKTPLSLVYFDLDHFKSINDNYGHPFGDEVLIEICKAIKKIIRAHDVFARIGGEEFAILLLDCDLESAKVEAERIRKAIESLQFLDKNKKTVPVTISLGVASLKQNEEYKAFYQRADNALYHAKNNGRNRVSG